MGEIISMQQYLERKAGPTQEDIKLRLAEIAIEQMVLASERIRLKEQLEGKK